MENASKALIIAGSVLLMILLLTFAIFVFKRIGAQSTEMYDNLSQSIVDEFNQKFYNYETTGEIKYDENGKPTNRLRIQDVVSILNLAKSYNQSQKYPIINVRFSSTNNMQDAYNAKQLLKEKMTKWYTCKVSMTNNTRFVDLIEITELNI